MQETVVVLNFIEKQYLGWCCHGNWL